jgi:hypothetical protein
MDAASLLLACLGIALGLAALGWQYATLRQSAGHAEVELRIGVTLRGAMLLGDPSHISPEELQRMVRESGGVPIMAARVRSVGRMPMVVISWGFKTENGVELTPRGGWIGPPLKHRIEALDEATWAAPFAEVAPLAAAAAATPSGGGQVRVTAFATLADGRTVSSIDSIPFAGR